MYKVRLKRFWRNTEKMARKLKEVILEKLWKKLEETVNGGKILNYILQKCKCYRNFDNI